jgi:hypothetical protein
MWEWGDLPDTNSMVCKEFSIYRTTKGRLCFDLGIDEKIIAEAGAFVVMDSLRKRCISLQKWDDNTTVIEVGPFSCEISREWLREFLEKPLGDTEVRIEDIPTNFCIENY